MMKKFFLLIILVLFSGLACYNPFSPPVVGPGFMVPIALQTDPDSVLQNFKYAYEYRDIITYENCLDKYFVFSYIDQEKYTGELIEVEVPRDGASGDIDRTKGVFKFFDDIRFETWEVFPLPSEYDSSFREERKVRQVNFHLVLRDIDGDYGYEHLEATGFALFKFRRSEDGYWRIVYWKDNSIQGY
jgi:hypothetical protein